MGKSTPQAAARVTEDLIVGGYINGPDELAWLVDEGTTHVISAAAELSDRRMCTPRGLGYYHVVWHDDKQHKPISDFVAALAWVRRHAATPRRTGKRMGLYVHCAMGINRGPLLATFLLAALAGLPADEAWAAMKQSRPQVESFDVPAYRQSCLLALEACDVNAVPELVPTPMKIAVAAC